LEVTPQSRLILRLAAGSIPNVLPLAGKRLEIDGAIVRVGVPAVHALRPASSVASRLVVIRGFMTAEPFLDAVRRQLDALGVSGTPRLMARRRSQSIEGREGARDPYVRRTLRIHDREIVGYALRVDGLEPEESIVLQQAGVGGRRHFGCGVCLPVRTGGTT
jgi:CRISPR-associated protein Cas6